MNFVGCRSCRIGIDNDDYNVFVDRARFGEDIWSCRKVGWLTCAIVWASHQVRDCMCWTLRSGMRWSLELYSFKPASRVVWMKSVSTVILPRRVWWWNKCEGPCEDTETANWMAVSRPSSDFIYEGRLHSFCSLSGTTSLNVLLASMLRPPALQLKCMFLLCLLTLFPETDRNAYTSWQQIPTWMATYDSLFSWRLTRFFSPVPVKSAKLSKPTSPFVSQLYKANWKNPIIAGMLFFDLGDFSWRRRPYHLQLLDSTR